MDDAQNTDNDKPDKLSLWPVFFCVLPIVVGVAVVLLIKQPSSDSPDTDDAGETQQAGVPSLGSRSRPLLPAEEPPKEEETTEPEDQPGNTEPEPEVVELSDWDIEVLISRLSQAARSRNTRGIQSSHKLLAEARPSERVDELLMRALDADQVPRVRLELFRALHADAARLRWVREVYRTRTGQMLGTADLQGEGESVELSEYIRYLIKHHPYTEPLPDIVRRVLGDRRPDWMLKLLVSELHVVAMDDDERRSLRPMWEDIHAFLQRGGLSEHTGHSALLDTWVLYHQPIGEMFNELRDSRLAYLLPLLLSLKLPARDLLTDADKAKLTELVVDTLTGNQPTELKAAVIRQLADDSGLKSARKIIEEGLDRRDENLGDYLVAFGRMARTEADLRRLVELADRPDVATAQGAVEGLRVSQMRGADQHLRKIIDEGANVGVKSQALGALLSRSRDRERILDQYLDSNREPSLRAVAVAHVQSADRLKQVVSEDNSLRVRQAALTRLGEMKDPSLRTFFLRIRDRDPSPVIRQQARQYAEELRRMEE
jgi:hypothetical protein